MLSNRCSACRFNNRPTARRCEACGAALDEFDTVPSALTRSGALAHGAGPQVGALWFDDLSPPPAPPRPARERQSTDATVLPGVTVREIRLGQPHVPALSPPPAAALPADNDALAAIKVAHRAAVRHARQAAAPPLPTAGEVLVMDADAFARNQLDGLLGDFGFHVRPVATLAQAALLAGYHPFAAVFVVVPPGAVDGAVHDLFEQARATGRDANVAPAVRVLLAANWSPVDRVRAELAGCDATLARPVNRRDLARVLDANGVVLPCDPRRA